MKILLFWGIIKITAAILGIAGEKKMIICLNNVGDGIFLVFRTVGYGVLFFWVLIAITAYSTNGGF